MAAPTTASLAIPKPKPFLIINQTKKPHSPKPSFSLSIKPQLSTSIPKNAAVLATVVSTLTLTSSPPIAMAAKKLAESTQQDTRGLAFLAPIIPAVGWALVNIMGPALNQIERMRNQRAVILGLGLGFGGLGAINLVPSASAVEDVIVSNSGDNNNNNNNGVFLAVFIAIAAFLEVILLSMKMKERESEEKRVTE